MFDKVTSEELAPLDYEERQAILEELAREEFGELPEAPAPAPEEDTTPDTEIPF